MSILTVSYDSKFFEYEILVFYGVLYICWSIFWLWDINLSLTIKDKKNLPAVYEHTNKVYLYFLCNHPEARTTIFKPNSSNTVEHISSFYWFIKVKLKISDGKKTEIYNYRVTACT